MQTLTTGQKFRLQTRCYLWLDDGTYARTAYFTPGISGIVIGWDSERVRLNIGHDRVASVEPWRLVKLWRAE